MNFRNILNWKCSIQIKGIDSVITEYLKVSIFINLHRNSIVLRLIIKIIVFILLHIYFYKLLLIKLIIYVLKFGAIY